MQRSSRAVLAEVLKLSLNSRLFFWIVFFCSYINQKAKVLLLQKEHVLLMPHNFFFLENNNGKISRTREEKQRFVCFVLFFCPSARFWVAQRKQAREEGKKTSRGRNKKRGGGGWSGGAPPPSQARINVNELHQHRDASVASKLAPEVLCLPEEEHKTQTSTFSAHRPYWHEVESGGEVGGAT